MKNVTFGVLVRKDNGQGFPDSGRRGRHRSQLRLRPPDEKPYVSGVHAVISRGNRCLVLEDLGGRNGTRVNRTTVSRKVLSDGDRIDIGRAELVFKFTS